MSRASATNDAAREADRLERELLASLGLGPGASNEQIETAHDAVVRFLDDAPAAIRVWATARGAAADESYALLRGPRADLLAVVVACTAGPNAPAASAPARRDHAASAEDEAGLDEFDREAHPTRGGRRELTIANQRGALLPAPPSSQRRMLRRLGLAAAAVAAVVIVVVGYGLGAPSIPAFTGSPAPEASSAAVDQAQVAALTQKLAADPKNIDTLQQVADLYYTAGDYATAATWMDKILAIDPKNVTGLLALGAADFNIGKLAEAEAAWRQVLAIDPKSVEAHYDLGFMYLSKNPPDLANVRKEWNEVIAIAPDSDVAKTVATHLQSLDGSPAPSAPTAAPSTAPSATPGSTSSATPAPSAPGG